MIIEFENIFESELVSALHRALDAAKATESDLVARIEILIQEAEKSEVDSLQ